MVRYCSSCIIVEVVIRFCCDRLLFFFSCVLVGVMLM